MTKELNAIAGDDANNFYQVDDFSALDAIKNSVAERTCEAAGSNGGGP